VFEIIPFANQRRQSVCCYR